MSARRRGAGFTLLEVLVAIAVFVVLSVLAYGGLRHVMSLDDGLRANTARHDGVALTLLLIEQDLRHAVSRGVRDELGEAEPALSAGLAGEVLSLTRVVPDLARPGARAALERIRYRVEDGALYRDTWERLDRTSTTRFRSRRLLGEVSDFGLRFFGESSWSEFWPRVDAGPATDALPDGIEIAIELGGDRSVRRVVVRS